MLLFIILYVAVDGGGLCRKSSPLELIMVVIS